jgi:two-component system, response regulator PdtaR
VPLSTHPAEHLPLLVLIVEDDPFIALELEDTLRQEGYYVLGPAHSVAAALDLLQEADPDLAILDFNLNGKKVTPVADVLSDHDVPFVLASANTEPFEDEVLANARNLGKPTDRLQLLNELERLTTASNH